MKPLYSLTPISDHAKELLTAIDSAKNPQKKEPIYTEGQIKGLASMYGYNRSRLHSKPLVVEEGANYQKENTVYTRLTDAHITVTAENIDQINDKTLIFNCVVDFATYNLYEECISRGIKFQNCTIYPSVVKSPLYTE